MTHKDAPAGETGASRAGHDKDQSESTHALNNPQTLSDLALARQVVRRTFEVSDGLTTSELIDTQEASAAMLAKLIGAGDVPDHLLDIMASIVHGYDAATDERLYERFARQYDANGGRHVA
jgi:hypothetical protein